MTLTGWIQIVVLVAVLTGLTPLLGGYMARVYQGDRVALTALVSPIERAFYRIFRVDRDEEHGWKEYARSLLLFSAASWLVLYVVLRTQAIQPFNPQGFTHSGPWDLSFNTASSFVSKPAGSSTPARRRCRTSRRWRGSPWRASRRWRPGWPWRRR